MSTKKTGLAAFARNKAESTATACVAGQEEDEAAKRHRGKGKTVALTVRLERSEWERLHQLAVSEGVSLQTLAVRGFSAVFAEKGLPPVKS